MILPPSCWLCLAAVAGIAFAPLVASAPAARLALWVLASIAAAACLGWAQRRRRGQVLAAMVATALACAWRSQALPSPCGTPPSASEGAAPTGGAWRVRLVGAVDHQTVAGPGASRWRVRARLLAEAVPTPLGPVWQPRSGEVVLRLRPGEPVARGDVLQVPLWVRPPPGPRNPGDGSEARWRWQRRLCGQAGVLGTHVRLERARGPWAVLDRFRQRAARRLEGALPSAAAAVAKAMVLGDTAGLDPSLRDAWADAGIAHLLAVSGLHLGLVMAATRRGLRALLGLWPALIERCDVGRLAHGVGLVAGATFACLTGGGWATWRATLMATTVSAGYLVQRPQAGLQALGMGGVVLLWLWPHGLAEPGLLLSFAAVAGLLCLLPGAPVWPAQAPADAGTRRRGYGRAGARAFGAWLRQALAVAVAAQLATAPLCAYFFGRLSVIGPLVNLVAVPVASLVAVPAGLAVALGGSEIGSWARAPLRVSVAALQALAVRAASPAWATVWMPAPGVGTAALWLGLGAGACMWQRISEPRWRARGQSVALAAGVALMAVWLRAWAGPGGDGALHVLHLDVGQGDATLVTFPHGATMLVDGGGSLHGEAVDPGRHVVAAVLHARAVRRLDVVVLTHPHPDHLGGLLYVTGRWPTAALWLNGDGADLPAVAQLVAQVHRRGGQVMVPPAALEVQGVTITTYQPLAGTAASLNERSIGVRLQRGDDAIFLGGDMEARAEARLAQGVAPAQVIKVGHHGSRTSSTSAFLARLAPQLAVISCGADNSFGFPHAEVLCRLEDVGATVLRTDVRGALALSTVGRGWSWRAYGPP